jgi:hypothetical protein
MENKKENKSKGPAIAGWFGMITVLTLYGLATNGILLATSVIFITLNLVGAMMLGVSAFATRNWPVVALNGVWAIISILSLIM